MSTRPNLMTVEAAKALSCQEVRGLFLVAFDGLRLAVPFGVFLKPFGHEVAQRLR